MDPAPSAESSDGPIVAHYEPTFHDHYFGTSLFFRIRLFRWPGRVLGGLMLCFSLMTFPSSENKLMCFVLFTIGAMLAFGPQIFGYFGAVAAQKDPKARQIITFTFTTEHYRIQIPGSEATVLWTSVVEVIQEKRGFLIFPHQYAGIWLPIRAFQDPQDLSGFTALLAHQGVKTKQI